MIIDHWSLIIVHWSLIIDHWSMINDHWSVMVNDNWALINDRWSMITEKIAIFQDGRLNKNMKKCENWLQKNSLGWKITFPGSVFYAGNDGDTHFAQKFVKLLKIKVFDRKQNHKNSHYFQGSDGAQSILTTFFTCSTIWFVTPGSLTGALKDFFDLLKFIFGLLGNGFCED